MPFDGTSKSSVAAQSMIVLDRVECFLDGGGRWARRTYRTGDGKCCLLGAIEHVRCETGLSDDRAAEYLAHAINLRQMRKGLPALGDSDCMAVMGFNDTYRRQFGDILEVVRQARELARLDAFVSSLESGQ
jgi:hypothetical protein